jgi:EmrB/QacA subfamily drug resistance transporter
MSLLHAASSNANEPIAVTRAMDGPTDVRRWQALPFLLGGYMMVFVAVTMLNVALPSAQADLGLSDSSRQWVLTVYSLTFGGLHLLGGRIADVVGLRRALLIGLGGFAASAVLGGIAPNGSLLLGARALQGAAGALVAPAAVGLLSLLFPGGPSRAKAFGILGTVMGVATAASFLVGGWLTDVLSWRWCLLVQAPIVLVAAAGVARTVPSLAATGRRRIDVVGAALITAAAGSLVLGFDRATKAGWGDAWTVTPLVAGVVLLAAFVIGLATSRQPLVPLALVADRRRGAGLLAVFTLAIGMFAAFFFVTVYLQDVLGYSPVRTGLAYVPFGVAAIAASRALAAWSGRLPDPVFLLGGLAAVAASLAMLTGLSASSSYTSGVLAPMLLLGIGGSAVMVTAQNMTTRGAGDDSGVAGAAVGAVQQIGAALGTALLGSIAASAATDHYGAAPPATPDPAWIDALAHGFARAAGAGAAILVAGAVIAGLLAGRRRTDRAAAT